MSFHGETIWIIGASSGIGRELATQLAKHGAQLILSARRKDELEKLQQEINGKHSIYAMDVSDIEQVNNVFTTIAISKTVIHRVIFLPALYKPDTIAQMDIAFMSKMIDVNIKGALYVTHSILPIFEKQHYGQIVLCGSVAGYTGLPNGQPYSATKAAIRNFTESLYAEAPSYLDVKLISPGFVSTPMTAKNNFDMPMIITPKEAASSIITGLKKKGFEIHFPKKFTYILKLLSILPYCLKLPLTKKMKKKL